ncbi:ABC transporter ATP-binding protein [Brevibacillus sp. B_LB10_24]|uniref:ABC transporter ATP-binding protein n=1 Tax=Brevibacillus sp. B_LB10_24 TaxID=3380645 RepID=UPI0038BC09D3
MLEIANLTKSYQLPGKEQIHVLNIARFHMNAQERVALVGPSGSGKSTLLNIIAGILRPTSGQIHLLDQQLERLPEAKLDRFRARHIGYVFQSFHLLPGYTVVENVLTAMRFGKTIPPKEQRQRAVELLSQVGLAHRLYHKPGQLSTGEQQRVSIARALANRPALVLADEPTASLDRDNAAQVFALLMETCRSNNAALLLCSHDLELAGRLDRMIHIRDLSTAETGGGD